jgi:hypothetical protein
MCVYRYKYEYMCNPNANQTLKGQVKQEVQSGKGSSLVRPMTASKKQSP